MKILSVIPRKLFAFDLDGTLLRRDKTLSNRTIRAINQLVEKGHLVSIATARPPRDVASLLTDVITYHYCICYNGAEVYKGRTRIAQYAIRPDLAYSLVQELAKIRHDLFIGVESDDTFHVNRSPAHLFGEVPYQQIAFSDQQHPVFSRGITKIIHEGLGTSSETVTLQSIQDACSVTHTDNGAIVQIMAQGVNKWAALQTISLRENVTTQDIVAFGDDHNDLAMLTSCGMGVAMANATVSVLAASVFRTSSNDDEGVALFLEKNFL
ncbi:HAD family hydrolase [Spirosoma panaciterrae]|uniref:HAD family hydrolase n=1 Tax=Spirosoma panaciterrae TaxID=496058 RepID=UPI0003797D70|nr:HAD family hydrolase [Spirosoma panaciterrae]